MAVGALRALRQAGRAVPQDVAVCGFDDVPLAGYLSLTTIRVHMTAVGARAAARLIDALEGCDAGAADEWITPELVVRGTTVTES